MRRPYRVTHLDQGSSRQITIFWVRVISVLRKFLSPSLIARDWILRGTAYPAVVLWADSKTMSQRMLRNKRQQACELGDYCFNERSS